MTDTASVTDSDPDVRFMREALAEAAAAAVAGEVPVGAVVVRDGQILAHDHNRREADGDPLGHAEMLVLRAAAVAGGDGWRLDGTTLYVTLEPCVMCAGAIVQSRVARVVYGASDAKGGACGTLYDIPRDPRLTHRAEVRGGVLSEECGAVLSRFFQSRRKRVEPSEQPGA
jgi:tRNA(adenine34) deaminase